MHVKKNGKWEKERIDLETAGLGNMTKKSNTPGRLWPLLQYFGEKWVNDEKEQKGNSCYDMDIIKWRDKKAGKISHDDPNIKKIVHFIKGQHRDRKLTKRVSDLRETVKDLFEIKANPIEKKIQDEFVDHNRYYFKCYILRVHWRDITMSLGKDEKRILYDIGGIFKGSISFQKLDMAKENGESNRFSKELIKILKHGGRVQFGRLGTDELKRENEEIQSTDEIEKERKPIDVDRRGVQKRERSYEEKFDPDDELCEETGQSSRLKGYLDDYEQVENEEYKYDEYYDDSDNVDHTEYNETSNNMEIWKDKVLDVIANKLRMHFNIHEYPFERDQKSNCFKTLFKVSSSSRQL